MKNYAFYKAREYNNVKEIINDAVRKYPNNVAFKIKNKNDKKITYREIKYKELGNEINYFGTALIKLGLKDERIAIISKNRYEWFSWEYYSSFWYCPYIS